MNKLLIYVFVSMLLFGCSTPYTYPRYINEMYMVGKKSLIDQVEKDDTMPICLNISKEEFIEESFKFVIDCAYEEKSSRPYEFSYSSAGGYATADGICARRKMLDKYKENLTIDNVPTLYVEKCKIIYSQAQ